MYISEAIRPRQRFFADLCGEHRVNRLYAFGSAVSGKFDHVSSDVDLLVEIEETDPIEKGSLLLAFYTAMEKFFKRKVDLLTDQPLKNPYLKQELDNTKVLIYDGESKKVLV